MDRTAKILLGIALMLLIFGAAASYAAFSAVRHAGMIMVSVDPKEFGQPSIFLPIPAAFVNAFAGRAITEAAHCAPREVREWTPAIEAALAEIEKHPNVTLVDVQDRDEHVRISMKNRDLVITVDSDEADVLVSVPTSTARNFFRSVAVGAAAAHDCECDVDVDIDLDGSLDL